MAQPEIFINKFQQGTSENSNVGIGTMVGVETYSKKGVAQLAKDTTVNTFSGGGFTAFPNMPKYIATSGGGYYYTAINDGSGYPHLYYSTDGKVWQDTTLYVSSSLVVNGLIFFPCVPKTGTLGYYILFAGTNMYYFQDGAVAINAFGTPITNLTACEHPTILNPFDGFVYFGNGNFVGKLGYGTNGTGSGGFDPTTATSGYYINVAQLTLPSYYGVTCLSFISPNYLALGTSGAFQAYGSSVNNCNSQIADIILWNPNLSTYETPLRLYSRSSQIGVSVTYSGLIQSGVASIINRNNTLYALTAGNYCLYVTNGINFSLVTDLSLRSTIRKTTGTENNSPVFISGYAPSMAIMGNKILIGVSTPFPIGGGSPYPTNYGLFPCGIWTVGFSDGGGIGEISFGINGTATQCEFTISTGTIVATTGIYQIGCILPTAGNSALISWNDNGTYGIDSIETNNYQNNIADVIIESQMYEVGTPLIPVTIGNLQINLVRNLMTGQKISVYYRTAFDQDFTLITGYGFTGTFTGDSTTNYYEITNNSIGQTRYIQFQVHLSTVTPATSATIATYTPQLRNFIIGTPTK